MKIVREFSEANWKSDMPLCEAAVIAEYRCIASTYATTLNAAKLTVQIHNRDFAAMPWKAVGGGIP